MSTNLGSLDQFIPKSQAETFARQLQSRLRSLSNDSTGEGAEESSWNGDHLSSSSENDVYYDLESCPSSPAEEALESDFSNYINSNQHEASTDPEPTNLNGAIFSLYDELQTTSQELQDCCGYCHDNKLKHNQNDCSIDNTITITNGKGPPTSSTIPTNSNHSSQIDIASLHHISNESKDLSDESLRREMSNHLHLNKVSSIEKFTIDNYSDNCTGNDYIVGLTSTNGIDDFYKCCKKNGHSEPFGNSETKPDEDLKAQLKINKSSHEELPINCTRSNSMIFSTPTINSASNGAQSNKLLVNETNILENNNHVFVSDCVTKDETKKPYYSEEALARLVDTVFNGCRTHEDISDSNSTQKPETNQESNGKDDKDKEEEVEDDDEEESIETRRSRFRRSSSLKTGKTPPGTPGKKKIVRFADVLGLDLTNVRTFMDEVPKVPKSAFEDLKGVEFSSSPPVRSFFDLVQQPLPPSSNQQKTIVPLFEQPSCRADFLDRVRDCFVCLENAMVSDAALSTITGIVRVKNIDFHKSVYIRYSIDCWKSFADLQARYVPNSCDGLSDKFSFVLYAHMLNVGQRLEFAIRFQAKGNQYWDNNKGANYVFNCVTGAHSKQNLSFYVPPSPIETWASFY